MRKTAQMLLALALLLVPCLAWAADTDGDGLQDEWELSYFVWLGQEDGNGDPDGDGLTNLEEQELGTDPTREDTDGDGLTDKQEVDLAYALDPTLMDTDGDFLMDGEEIDLGTDPTKADSDFDGLTDYIEVVKGYDPLEGDTDNGGVWDGEEVLVDKTDPLDPSDDLMDSDNDGITNYNEFELGTNPFAADTDADWLSDGEEDADQDGIHEPEEGETDPVNPDTDGDGLKDGWEVLVYKTDPFVQDSDGDGLLDGEEHELRMTLYACLDPNKLDSDKDGLPDGEEAGADGASDPCVPDTDGDGLLDVSELFDGTDPNDGADAAVDTDGDGLSDGYEAQVSGTDPTDPDTDGDFLADAEEHLLLSDGFETDPLDADTDDDGILDGNEKGKLTEDGVGGGTDPTDADTDGDKLLDGLEKGLTEPQQSAKDPDATDLAVFQADTDPSTKTSPMDGDSDDDGLKDGTEDADHDGAQDANETDPNIFDTDGDGMDDHWEWTWSTEEACGDAPLGPLDPLDPGDKGLDNDGDGLSNFKEYQNTWWQDNQEVKNQTNPCSKDSDGDGLTDLTEVNGKYNAANPVMKGTDPNNPDTDGDGLGDGVEDADHNGKWHPFLETNPTQKDTDGDNLDDGFEINVVGTQPNVGDTDGDGLNDGTEYNLFGTDPLDPDTDDDGLGDGLETGVPWLDACPESKSNPHLADSDGDGLDDGEEDLDLNGCWDKDKGETNPLDPDTDGDKLSDGMELGVGKDTDPTTTTDPLAKDTDQDGLWDSHEDKNKNGKVDENETDPNDKDTDDGGVADGTEVLVDGTDPLDPKDDLVADPDGDGLTNGEEKKIGTNPYDKDSDGDTISDTVEVGENHLEPPDSDDDGTIDALDTDSDDDGIPDAVEAGDADLETDPVNSDGDALPDYLDDDSDGDTISDAVEWAVDADKDGNPDPDADKDGTPNYLDLDSDDAQGPDQEEGTGDADKDGIPNFVDPVDDPPENLDYDGDGLKNTEEEEVTGTNPYDPDTDGDGLDDKTEWEGPTDPLDADCDDDGLPDGEEGLEDTDGDGLIHAWDPDSDDDGIFDGTERGKTEPIADKVVVAENGKTYTAAGTSLAKKNFRADVDPTTMTDHTAADSDGDGADDGAEDPNHNGKVDVGEMDPLDGENAGLTPAKIDEILADDDGDGLTNRQEWGLGIVAVDSDLDDDGLPDGSEHNWRNDTDLDGLPNFRDPDSDGDLLADGLEEGVVELAEGTWWKAFNATPDADPASTTWMLVADSDGDGLSDGLEDANGNGAVDEGESDPNDAEEAVGPQDVDGDGLPDEREALLGSSPEDGDTDDDGVLDGAEPNGPFDTDGDGLAAVLDPDSDNDGLADGTELGITDAGPDTDVDAGRFVADADPATTTWATVWDSDGSGVSDGGEDTDKDGAQGEEETDPNDAMDDGMGCDDTDTDGLCNAEEEWFGLDPFDLDSDDDGLFDGDEHNWNFDTDGDGLPSVLDPDSDGDGLFDGTEMGVDVATGPGETEYQGETVALLGTDVTAGFFAKDEDPETTTFMLVADTDRGGFLDGAEDLNGNGRVDEFETDPNDPADDLPVDEDYDGDGLSNGLEKEIGTDPYDVDSDGDTIPDPVEVGEDTANPLDTDGDGTIDALDTDSDDDTIPDAVEAGDDDLETDPVDSDGDGLPDYRDTDSDDDGLSDEEEVTWYLTDPTKSDTDGGGAGDFLEVTDHHSDPNDPTDDFRGWFEEGARVQGGGCGAAGGAMPGALALALLLVAGLLVVRFRRGLPVVLALAWLAWPGTVQAQYQPDPVYHPDAFKTGVAANSYRLVPDEGIFSVHHGKALEHFEFRGGVALHYAYNPLAVVVDGEVSRQLVGQRFESHLQAAFGFLGFLEVGVQAPFVLYQQGEFPGMKLGSVDAFGIGNISAFAKLEGLSAQKYPVGVAVVLPVFAPAVSGHYAGFDGWGLAPTLAVSANPVEPLWLSLNVGYLLQPETTILNIVDDDKITAGLGATWQVTKELEAGLELTGATRAGAPFADGEELQAEVDAGVKYRIGSFRIIAGAGKGVADGFSTPVFRVFGGVEYAWKPNPDRDGDGIPNLRDDCPDEAEDADGFKDSDGCPDFDNDNDRNPDKTDQCPNEAEDFDNFRDEDGCPDPDNDGDGIKDPDDQCPLKAEDLDKFQDEDGCPDPDNDNDGIPDTKDKCPNEPETLNDYQDEDGCPDKKLAEFQKEARRIQILDRVHFKFMSAEIQPASFEMLDQVAQILKDNPQVRFVQVEGHTDRTGEDKFNMGLSLDRAQAVVDHLVQKGVEKDRLRAKGYGSTRPVDYRSGPEANLNNRRVEFNILKYDE
jgi:outer membrane protein OmpA-like peptidoglycan-associated protein